jgi:hypothetical protein
MDAQFLCEAPLCGGVVRLAREDVGSDGRTPVPRMPNTGTRELLNEEISS